MGISALGGNSGRAGHGNATETFGTGLLHRLVAQVSDGRDVVVHDPTGGGPILDLLAVALRARRCRVLRFKATGKGRVSDLLGQLTGEACDSVPDEKTLERSFELLCTPDAECSRIVLLVGNAHLMSRKEFRYLHLAAKSGPLQFVLAATDNPLGQLDGDLVLLHNRLAALDPVVIEPGTPLAVAIPSTPRPPGDAPSRPAATGRPAATPRQARPRRLAELGAVAAIASAVIVFAGVGLNLLHAVPGRGHAAAASTAPAPSPADVAAAASPMLPTAAAAVSVGPSAVALATAPGVRAGAAPAQSASVRPNRAGPAAVPHRWPQQAARARPAQIAAE